MTKMTLTMPDDLRRRVKAAAALRNEHVSDVVRRALEAYIAEVMEEEDDIQAVDEIEARMARGEVRLHDWDEVKAELNALPD